MKKPKEPVKGNAKDKDPKNKQKQGGKTAKDLFPPNSPHLKNLREQNPINNEAMSNEEIKEIKDLIIISKPDDIFPEWPDEETLTVKRKYKDKKRKIKRKF